MNTLLKLFGDSKIKSLLLMGCFLVLMLLPMLHTLPTDSALYMSDYWLKLTGRIMCFAMVALAIDLVWGYAGILSLGHGLYFGLGAYAMGMYLTQATVGDSTPEFVGMTGLTELPWFFTGTEYFGYAVFLAMFIPGLVAFIFGFFAFRSKIKGVYYSIITQAMTYAAWLLFLRNETGFGGNNGFTNFKTILGFSLSDASTKAGLAFITALLLMLVFLALRWLVNRPYGKVLEAVRDGESRLQYLGYNPLYYKLSVWVLSAVISGIAGALYVTHVGIINPNEMSTINSIEMVVWVATGGRGTLTGAMIGAGFVGAMKSYFTGAFSEGWMFILGALFICVTIFLPQGILGLFNKLSAKFGKGKKSDSQIEEASS